MVLAKSDRVVKKLINANITISTMESCTSGLIASMITDTEGASAIFPGGYVTYLNETKVLVGVNEEVIRQYGVYSRECAQAMAETVQKNLHRYDLTALLPPAVPSPGVHIIKLPLSAP